MPTKVRKPKELTIDRETWCRGEGIKNSYLLRKDGLKCCLGFLGAAVGYKDEELLMRWGPGTVHRAKPLKEDSLYETLLPNKFPKGLLKNYQTGEESDLCKEIILVNDNPYITEEEREAHLKKLFSKLKWMLNFDN